MSDLIHRAELFNKLAEAKAPPEANKYKAEVYGVIQELPEAEIFVVTEIKRGEEPIHTGFDNEPAARAYSYYLMKKYPESWVLVDKPRIYSKFIWDRED